MNPLKYNGIRTFARNTRIIKIYSTLKRIQEWVILQKYNPVKDNISNVKLNDINIKMYTESINEYKRVISYKNDSKILNTLLMEIKADDVFWDVGANIGLYSCLAAASRNNFKAFAFEPEDKAYNRLKENIELNGLTNTFTYKMALADKSGKLRLKIAEHFADGNHSLLNSNPDELSIYEEVEIIKGDDLIINDKIDVPNIIKIDVEGFEYNVLQGLIETLKNKRCRIVLTEVHFSQLNAQGLNDIPQKIYNLLTELGFYIKWIDHSHFIAKKIKK